MDFAAKHGVPLDDTVLRIWKKNVSLRTVSKCDRRNRFVVAYAAAPIEQLFADAPKDREGKRSGAHVEIKCALGGLRRKGWRGHNGQVFSCLR
jgi:hypothetical protein